MEELGKGTRGKNGTLPRLLIGSFPFQLHSPVPSLCARSDTRAHADMRAGPAHTILAELPSATSASCALAVADRKRKRTSAVNEKDREKGRSESSGRGRERSKSPTQRDPIAEGYATAL